MPTASSSPHPDLSPPDSFSAVVSTTDTRGLAQLTLPPSSAWGLGQPARVLSLADTLLPDPLCRQAVSPSDGGSLRTVLCPHSDGGSLGTGLGPPQTGAP